MTCQGGLPPELVIQIAAFSSPSSVVALEQLCRSWKELIRDADTTCWRHRALLNGQGMSGKVELTNYLDNLKDRCVNKAYWEGVHSWKELCSRLAILQDNWSACTPPKTQTEILGFTRVDPHQSALPVPRLRSLSSSRMLDVPYASQDASYVWRARLDTERDANFILTTWHTGGLRVVDADLAGKGRVLWELPQWSVQPYAHLEYARGVACWDNGEGVEVWKRWKLVLGTEGEDEPPNKRGQFVKVATLPTVPNTRGFMLNDDLHLTICSSDGKSITFNLASNSPCQLYSYDIAMTANNGPAGHIEHDREIAVYSMGQKGYTIYHKESATLLGNLDLSNQTSTLVSTLDEYSHTNFFSIDRQCKYGELAANGEAGVNAAPRKQFVLVKLEQGGLTERVASATQTGLDEHEVFLRLASRQALPPDGRRTNAIPLHSELWGAAMIRKLEDGATLFVARSRGGRVLICSDLLGLLATLQNGNEEETRAKVRECLAVIECGGRGSRTEFYTGGWLAVHNGRAAWEIDDLVYMCVLPKRRNSLPKVGSMVWMLASHYDDEVPMPDMQVPISFMSLHDDVFMSTFLHPSYVLVRDQTHSRWETGILKSVRLIHFTPPRQEAQEDDEDNALYPLTRANKDLHRRWVMTGRRLAPAPESDEEWTDEDEEAGEE